MPSNQPSGLGSSWKEILTLNLATISSTSPWITSHGHSGEASAVHEGSGYAITEAKVKVGGKLRCNATLTFSHVPFPNPDLRGHMDAVAKRIGFPMQAIA